MKPLSILVSRLQAWTFLFRGSQIIQDGFKRSKGAPFFVDVPENRYHIVSSWEHIKEIDAASDGVLSLQGAAKEILQPKHTMTDFNWLDKRGAEGAPLLKTLRIDLAGHLPVLLPDIRRAMSGLLDDLYTSQATVNGMKQSPLYPMVIKTITKSNALAFFGKHIADNEEFMRVGSAFIEETLIIAEVCRLLPDFVSDRVGKLLSNRLNSGKIIHSILDPVIEERFEERIRKERGHQVPEHNDCIQWVMDNSPKSRPWTVTRVVHELMALWFGSVHITATTACFVLFDLCLHPEYIAPLREEIEKTGWQKFDESSGKAFPLMDSFMKESARLTPVESVSTRRMALKPFQLSDGTKVKTGQWICSAARAMNVDPAAYPYAQEFHGFRFVEPEVIEQSVAASASGNIRIPESSTPSAFTKMEDWQLWGTGKYSCHGRFYASAAIKTMLALFITKWDIQLEDPDASRFFAWRTFIYPYASTRVILRPTMEGRLG